MTRHIPSPEVSEALLLDALEALNDGIAIYDAEERLVLCNSRYRDMLGSLSDMIVPGMRWRDLIHGCVERGVVPEETADGTDWVSASEKQRAAFEQKTEIRQLNGRTYEVSYSPTRNGGFVVTRADVTERRQTEALVREREALLTTILDTNPTPILMSRLEDGQILYRSPAAADLFGQTDRSAAHYVDPADRARFVSEIDRSGIVREMEIRFQSESGRTFTGAISGGLTQYNGEVCIVSSTTDMTAHLEREAVIRKVVESCPAPVLMNRARTGEILFKSPELEALFGKSSDSRSFYVDPEDRVAFLDALRATGEVVEYRARFYNARREPIWAAISARLIEFDGEEVIVSHARDLTGQLSIEAELSRQREQMFQNEKMSALGSLLAGVAHELNNPLSVVVGHAMMLQDETDDPDIRRQIGKISTAAERCAKIVKTFLTMARQEPLRVQETDLNEVVQTAVEVARFGDGARAVDLHTYLEADLPALNVDADQITQVILNLILNAEQAVETSGRGDHVIVRTETEASGKAVRILVEDNGPGIPADIRGRVFEPFFTTKDTGKGTGIGLSVCHRILTAHNGDIRLETGDLGGARFVVSLPILADAPPKADRSAPPRAAQRTARVLVIDDERDVADLNAEILTRSGIETRVAYKAEDAFRMLREDRFDAVISDLNMPDIDGRGVFDAICAEFAYLVGHTGFITGDTMGRASQIFLKESQRPYLEKPVSPKELREFTARLMQNEDT